MKMLSQLMLLMVCAVASSSELRLRCPEPTADSPMAVYNMAWLCDLFKWRDSIADFKKRFESECNVTDVETQWQEMYECPDFSNITCKQESSLTNRTDSFNCSILFCKDGHYENEDALPGIWRQQFHFHRTVMNFSDSINCTRECPVTETPVEGPSCAKLGKCCTGTDDLCLISGNGTTCHCDENCIHNQDCCSDYELICKGETSTQVYEDTATAEDLADATTLAVMDEATTQVITTEPSTNETRNATQANTNTTQTEDAALATAACSGGTSIVDKLNGTISSPNYPDNYPNNAQCSWYISVPDGMVITVQPGWLFNIESCSACSCDYLQLNNGQRICGQYFYNMNYQTTANYLSVIFSSDLSQIGGGFSFNWVASTPPSTTVASVEDSETIVDEGSSSTDSTVSAIEEISTEHDDYGNAVTNDFSDYGLTNDQSALPEAETTPTTYDYGTTEY